jgi:hypothetical protein
MFLNGVHLLTRTGVGLSENTLSRAVNGYWPSPACSEVHPKKERMMSIFYDYWLDGCKQRNSFGHRTLLKKH